MIRCSRLFALVVLGLGALAGCGRSSSGVADACRGLPVMTHPRPYLVVFGNRGRLSRSFICAHYGAPTSVSRDRNGSVEWRYPNATVIFENGRFVGSYGKL